MRHLILTVLTLIALTPAAAAEKRIALIIGNSAYANAPRLVNPKNDAEDIAAALKRVGFETIVGYDLDKNGMENAAARFARAARDADTAMFYYSGHAMQFAGNNYLMPVDAKLTDEADLRFLVRTDSIVADLQQAKSLRMLVLDSCRDNPLAEDLKRSIGRARSAGISRGLAKIDSPQGMIVAYATQAGRTADDGRGRNSPYTTAFLKHIEQPAEIGTVFRRISADVFSATQNTQLPELSLSLIGEFYLKPPPPAVDNTKAETARQTELAALQDKLRVMQEQLDKKESASKQAAITNAPDKQSAKRDGPVLYLRDANLHIGGLSAATFANDRTVVSWGGDDTVKFWNVDTLTVTYASYQPGIGTNSVSIAVAPDKDNSLNNERLVINTYSGIYVFKGFGGNAPAPKLAWKDAKASPSSCPSGFAARANLVARSGEKNAIRLYDFETGKILRTLNEDGGECGPVALSQDGKRLVSNKLKLWDTGSGKLSRELSGPTKSVAKSSFAIDDKQIAFIAGGQLSSRSLSDGSINVMIRARDCFDDGPVAFSNGLIFAGCFKTLIVIHGSTGNIVQTLTTADPIKDIAVSPDGERLMTKYSDRVGIWEVDEFYRLSDSK